MPGFTHLKNAQAVSFAHYLMAYIEMFNRDQKRFNNNLDNLNENPLGVAALAGTSFNIDRNYTSKKLNFKSGSIINLLGPFLFLEVLKFENLLI